ncbi:MAG: twin-arginine translocase subunit TatC [Steroidobacteraceae bacterium]
MSDPDKENLSEGTLISHLLELRDRLMKAFAALFIFFAPAIYFRNEIFSFLAQPLLDQLQVGTTMIATSVVSSFTAPLKLAFFAALFAAMPYILAQLWGFVSPGLYRKEKRFAVPLLVSSILLFYVGVAFAYFFVLPKAFSFFVKAAPSGVTVTPDINIYLDMALGWFLAFGVAFEVPVVVVLLTLTGLVTVEKLAQSRGYVIIGIFVVAAVLTPPDVLSQCLMAIPMWLLFEAGLLFSRILNRKPKDGASDTGSAESKA